MRRRRLVSAVAALGLGAGTLVAGVVPAAAAGSVSLTAVGAQYTENFDTLASSGTSSVVPNGWDFAETGTNANTVYTAGTGSGNAGDTYSFGASGSGERAFGGLLSGSLVPTIGASFTNNTGVTITSLAIGYTLEQWRLGTNDRGPDRLDVQYSLNATSLTTGTWTDANGLDGVGPVTTGGVGARDGNAAGNRSTVAGTVSELIIPNGTTFWIRWSDFNVTGADDGLAVDDFSLTAGAVELAPAVVSSTPADGVEGVPADSDLSVTFSEPVDLLPPTVTCSSTSIEYVLSGGPATFTLDPVAPLPGGTCTLTIPSGSVKDQDAEDPPDTMEADYVASFWVGDACLAPYTPAYAIQGTGAAPAITGTVSTQGVVVGDYEYPGSGPTGSFLRGFYLQDLAGDGDPSTSDAIFVFNGNADSVDLGDVVRVRGTAADFQDQTQVAATTITACGTGDVAPVDVTFPVASPTFLERYEGMLVRLPQTMTVTEHFQLGRFGQVVLSEGGRLQQPTSVVAPGAPANTLQAQNNLRKIIVDDESQAQNPDPILFGRGGQPLSASNTLRGGDTVTGVVGVMTYTWAGNAASGNAYRVRPINALGGGVPDFQPTNPRPASAPALAAGADVRVAGMNLLNYFNTFDGLPDTVDNCTNGVGGPPTDCRGADTAAEFARQWPKTVAGILGTGADVIGINEIENDGYGPDSAIAHLVGELNAGTAPGTYAFIDVDARTGQVDAMGTDAIKVGMIYKPGAVTPVGQTGALNTVAFVNGGDGAPRSRPSLAQAFEDVSTGERFVVDVNHLKSKGSACDAPDAGDGQGNCNLVRTNAAIALADWLATDPTGTGEPDVLIVGDLNSYAKEDPITALRNAGYTNLVEDRLGPDAYSYVFDGQWGYLDHALGNPAMDAQVAGVHEWHINADEPSVLDYNTDFKTANLQATLYAPDEFRISDHDPILVDLNLDRFQLVGNTSGPPAINTVNAGSALPLIFTIEGDEGGATLQGVTTTEISCDEKTTLSGPVPAIVNDFSYDADSGRYTLVLKTQKSWADTCRRVDATLSDGSVLSAYVRLA